MPGDWWFYFGTDVNQKAEAVMISNGINMDGFMSTQLTEEDFSRMRSF